MNNNTFEEVLAGAYKFAEERDLLHKENSLPQMGKIEEEVDETREALEGNDHHNLKLEIGDIIVSTSILAFQNDLHPTDCFRAAVEKIKNRKGKTINGTFIKEESLK